MIYLNILAIAVIFTIITDISDFPNSIKKVLRLIVSKGENGNTNYRLHLLDCSFCQIFWASIIYLLVIKEISLINIGCVLLFALTPDLIKGIILLVKDSIILLIQKLNNKL